MSFSAPLIKQIRAKFPQMESDSQGKRVFLDNGAGSLVLGSAMEAELAARRGTSQNKGAIYPESREYEETVLDGRQVIADLLNAPDVSNIIQGESASDLFFKIAYALSKGLTPSDNVVSTYCEHYSNFTPYQEFVKRGAIGELRLTRLNKEDGTLDLDHMRELVDRHTKVVTVAASSNLLWSKIDLKEVGKIANSVGAYFIVDAVHRVPQGPVDVQEIDCDFLVFSGYKFFGPHGSYSYLKESAIAGLSAYHVDPFATAKSSSMYELGTRDQAKFAAMRAVIDYMVWLSEQVKAEYKGKFGKYKGRIRALRVAMDAIENYGKSLSAEMLRGVGDVPGLRDLKNVQLLGNTDPARVSEREPTFAFKVKGKKDDFVGRVLWEKYRIASRHGHFLNNAHEFYEIPSTSRVTLLHYNTEVEVRDFLRALSEISGSP